MDADKPNDLPVATLSQEGSGHGETFANAPPGTYYLDIIAGGLEYTITVERCEGGNPSQNLRDDGPPVRDQYGPQKANWSHRPSRGRHSPHRRQEGASCGRTSLSGCRSHGASRGSADSGAQRLEAVASRATIKVIHLPPRPRELPVGVITGEGKQPSCQRMPPTRILQTWPTKTPSSKRRWTERES